MASLGALPYLLLMKSLRRKTYSLSNLGALPDLWLQAKLTISLKFWLRGDAASVDPTVRAVACSLTIRVAEHLAKYLSRLMRHAEDLADPTRCLMYPTYWFRPILTELLGCYSCYMVLATHMFFQAKLQDFTNTDQYVYFLPAKMRVGCISLDG